MRNAGVALLAFLAALLVLPRAGAEERRRVRAAQWNWVLPAERYKALSVFERAQYDKAAAFFKNNDFRASAAEFEKFKVQFQDSASSSSLAYVNFMHGYCLLQAKDRNAAIKAFTEVLDYFKNETEDAAAALFFKGVAHLENGDLRKGLQCMQQMADDEQYRYHPLAAGALRRLAENSWKNNQIEAALRCWKQVCADFGQSNPQEAHEARSAVTAYYLRQGDFAGYENWICGGDGRENVQHRRWVALTAVEVAMSVFDFNNYGQARKEEHAKAAKAFFAWYKAQRNWFEKARDLWTYYDKGIQFLVHRLGDKKERDEMADEMAIYIKSLRDSAKDDNQRNDAHHKLSWLVDRLCEMGDWIRAQLCADTITDAPYAGFKTAEILGRRQKWPEAVAKLQDVEKTDNPYWSGRAKEERARIYKDVTGEYEKAIKLYQEIDKPPGTIWSIQDCYKRWGKLKEALATLTEIENSFPDQAAAAAWRKVQYLEEAQDKTAVIAGCRRILKAYKASPEASHAHQLLEKDGIKTGGGVFEGE
jgi:tetratricopeptide (TPR) repeat protein